MDVAKSHSLKKPKIKLNYRSLVLQGGGTKGYIYVGVLQELERLGLLATITEVAGSSVGALTDLYVASNYTAEQIKQITFGLNFKHLLLDNRPVFSPINFAEKFGFFNARHEYQLLRQIIKNVTGDENTTFEQWHVLKLSHPEKNLKDMRVEACNIGTGFNEVFSYETEHKDVPIADAIRASMAYPFVFAPVIIKGNRYNDGGMQNNCPMSAFANKAGFVGEEVLGVCLEDLANIRYYLTGQKPRAKKINNAFECAESQIEAMLKAQSYALMTGPCKDQIIYCDTLGAGTLDFHLSQEKKEALATSGKYGVMLFMAKHHPEFAMQHYSKRVLARLEQAEYPLSITEFLAFCQRHAPESLPQVVATWQQQLAFLQAEGCVTHRRGSVTPLYKHRQAAAVEQFPRDDMMEIEEVPHPKTKPGRCVML